MLKSDKYIGKSVEEIRELRQQLLEEKFGHYFDPVEHEKTLRQYEAFKKRNRNVFTRFYYRLKK